MLSTTAIEPIPLARRGAGWRPAYAVLLMGLSWWSTAVSWQAQLVSYPLFRSAGREEFAAYHLEYNDSIPFVVVVPGFLMFLAGVAFVWARPRPTPRLLAIVVSVASLASLLVTVLWAIPKHDELDRSGQSAATIDSLLDANLVRSLALSTATISLTWIVLTMTANRTRPTQP